MYLVKVKPDGPFCLPYESCNSCSEFSIERVAPVWDLCILLALVSTP